MLKWIADWWRFLLVSMAIGTIAAVAKRFLDGWIADSVVTFISLIGGANMIFDLIGRRSWEQRLAEKNQEVMERDREIMERDRKIAEQDREIAAQNQEIFELRLQAVRNQEREERDRRFAAQDQEISSLRQQVEELQQKINGQSQNQSEE